MTVAPQLLLAFMAGSLTTLSPCVLPVLPFILGSAGVRNKFAPLFICAGLVVSFVVFGWTLSAFGSTLGLNSSHIRLVGAVFLGFFGLILLVPKMSEFFAMSLQNLANRANQKLSSLKTESSASYFLLGCLLGAVWSPCSGPTLGAAVVLAAQSNGKLASLFIMICFGIGSIFPLLFVAYGASHFFRSNQKIILKMSFILKNIFGLAMIMLAILIFTGLDKKIESGILNLLPDSWIDLTTKF